MVALKIIGISLAVILGLIVLLLLLIPCLRLKLCLSYDQDGRLRYRIKVLCFSFGGKKKESKIGKKIKKLFGLDVFDNQDKTASGVSEKVGTAVALITVFAGQIKFIFSKLRLEKLGLLIICGDGDAADAAMDYGLVCASVYPLVGYLTASINTKKGAEDVRIGCDFDGDSKIEFDIRISVRIRHLLSAFINAMGDMAEISKNSTEVTNEQR
ncbi:MAG: hypothetical protein IKU23_01040 [Clostridia bacterium]|nr:hypothetical protein [Clostridia bacterium]